MEHLGPALLAASLFVALVVVLRILLSRSAAFEGVSAVYIFAALAGAFCLYWLPVFLAGGFVQDDWMLLAAASIRKIVLLHPIYSWHALDSIDGNFRPLSTVLYFGYMLKLFGLHAHAFLACNFVINLFGSMITFVLTRELGYGKVTGAAASVLYMSRGLLFTENAWACDVCDGAVVLLCALATLAILRACRSTSRKAIAYHVVAWGLFFLSTLTKQSSFVMPLIIAALLFFHPGPVPVVKMSHRIRSAVIAFVVYSATAAFVFLHAKSLMQSRTPYPIEATLGGVLVPFRFISWYLLGTGFPAAFKLLNNLILLLGVSLTLAVGILAWKCPRIFGPRPRDIAFLLVAAFSSITLFFFLPSHVAAYYGALFSFWLSIALAISLTSFGPVKLGSRHARISCFIFCLLAVSGFLEIRLMQTALYPSGGYIWGTFGADLDRAYFTQLKEHLEANSYASEVVLVDAGGYPSYYVSMVLLLGPNVRQILAYDSASHAYYVNNRNGLRPGDSRRDLTDADAFQWTVPANFETASAVSTNKSALCARYDGRLIEWSTSGPDGMKEKQSRVDH